MGLGSGGLGCCLTSRGFSWGGDGRVLAGVGDTTGGITGGITGDTTGDTGCDGTWGNTGCIGVGDLK